MKLKIEEQLFKIFYWNTIMNGVCDLSSSKAALPVQKYVEEYSIIKYFFLLRKNRYCFLFPVHPIHSTFLSLIKQYFYGLYPKIFNSLLFWNIYFDILSSPVGLNAWAHWSLGRVGHANLSMLCTACFLMFKFWFCYTNTINTVHTQTTSSCF